MHLTRTHKRILAVVALCLAIGAFAYYGATRPEVLRQLGRTDSWLLAALVLGYGVFTLTLAGVQYATLRLIKLRLPRLENLLLTAYSSIANFFGPLQSGPGVRLAYLKARYNINVKAYVAATFVYYGFFALISGFMLTAGVLAWWQTLMVLLGIGGGSWWFVRRKQRAGGKADGFTALPIMWLGLATLVQLLVVSGIYFAELRGIDAGISYGQALTYTGAANFALFVSVTPGAVGFRESFLLFTQQLHGIPSDQILLASLVDRSANVVFLGILLLVTLATHAGQRFSAASPAAARQPSAR